MPCAFSPHLVLGVPNAPIQELSQECAFIIHRDLDLFEIRGRHTKDGDKDTSLWA